MWIRALFLFLMVAVPLIGGENDLRDPPPFYSWQWCDEIQAGLLKPDGWHYMQSEINGNPVFLITEDPVENNSQFNVGFQLTVIRDAQNLNDSKDPKKAAKEFIEGIVSIASTIHERNDLPYGSGIGGHSAIMQYTVPFGPEKEVEFVSFNLVLLNPETNTLYLVVFLSPLSKWDDSWKKGETISQQMVLDFEY